MKTALSLILIFLASAVQAATFTATQSMSTTRAFHTSTALLDGRIFLAGGATDASCEIYDPATGVFHRTAPMTHSRNRHTATLLNDGRVLIAGGNVHGAGDLPPGTVIDYTAEIFDPQTETFSSAGNMTIPRYSHSATRLQDGRVLITGGAESYNILFSVGFRPQAHTEIYDPATNLFTAGPDMQTPRWNHTSTTLPDGRVLVVGFPSGVTATLPRAEMFNAAATSITAVPNAEARNSHTATLMNDGRVLIAGGDDQYDPAHSDAEVFQPSTGFFQPVSNNTVASYGHTATLLNDGRVLLAGWNETLSTSQAAVIFDPATNSISATASMVVARRGHAASRLANGKVLVTGGNAATAEIFDPQGVAPTVSRHRPSRS